MLALMLALRARAETYVMRVDSPLADAAKWFETANVGFKEIAAATPDLIVGTRDEANTKFSTTRRLPIRKPITLEKQGNATTNFVSFIGTNFPPELFQFVRESGMTPISTLVPDCRFIVCETQCSFKGYAPTTADIVPPEAEFVIMADQRFWDGVVLSLFQSIAIVLFCAFTITTVLKCCIMADRLHIKNGEAWICNEHGVPLTFHSLHISRYFSVIKRLINQVRINKDSAAEIVKFELEEDGCSYWRIHIHYLNDNVFMGVFWREKYDEIMSSEEFKFTGGEVHLDDCQEVQVPVITTKFAKGNKCEVSVDFKIDDSPCTVLIKPKSKDMIPFGQQSLLSAYIWCLHLGVLVQGISLHPTMSAFKKFTSDIAMRMEFKCLCIFVVVGQELMPVVMFCEDEEIESLVKENVDKVPRKSIAASVTMYHSKNYRLAGSRFSLADHDYIVMIGISSWHIALCETERNFHMLLSMIVAHNHALICAGPEARIFRRINSLIKGTKHFLLATAIGKSDNFVDCFGTLFGQKTTVEKMKKLAEAMVEQKPDIFIRQEGSKSITQAIVPLHLGDVGQVYISVMSTNYFDETRDAVSYIYLIEDVTAFHKKSRELDEAHEDRQMVSDFLGFHQVNEDHSLVDPLAFGKELGYEHPITNIDDVIHPDDRDKFGSGDRVAFRAMSALGHPVSFSAVRAYSHGGYLVFSTRDIRQMKAMFNSEDHSIVVINDTERKDTFILCTYDIETGKVQEIVTHHKINEAGSEGYDIEQWADMIHTKDRSIFLDHLMQCKQGNIEEFSCITKLAPNNEWYSIFGRRIDGQKIIIVMVNIDKDHNSMTEMANIATKLDLAFQNSTMVAWAFENTSYPERSFTVMPLRKTEMIFNWTTVESNVRRDFVNFMKRKLKLALETSKNVEIVIPMLFENVRWYLFRGGLYGDSHMTGNAVDLSSFFEFRDANGRNLAELQIDIPRAQERVKTVLHLVDAYKRVITCLLRTFRASGSSVFVKEAMEFLLLVFEKLGEQAASLTFE